MCPGTKDGSRVHSDVPRYRKKERRYILMFPSTNNRSESASPKPHPSKAHPCNMPHAKTKVALQLSECCAAEVALQHSLFCSAEAISTKSCAAANEKLQCNIEKAALQKSGVFLPLSCGFQAPAFRHPHLGLAERGHIRQNRPFTKPPFCFLWTLKILGKEGTNAQKCKETGKQIFKESQTCTKSWSPFCVAFAPLFPKPKGEWSFSGAGNPPLRISCMNPLFSPTGKLGQKVT